MPLISKKYLYQYCILCHVRISGRILLSAEVTNKVSKQVTAPESELDISLLQMPLRYLQN